MKKFAISLELPHDEALVLFDWLGRYNKDSSRRFQDQAEERALWNLEAALESALPEVTAPDYKALVVAARAAIRDEEA